MITDNTLISVIVPVYNVEPYLRVCLDSIINQTYKNIEIIIVNDGSTDKSEMICEEYKKNDHRIVLINQRNSGLSAARNSGVKVARGRYIGFVDSDDFIYPDMYECLVKNMVDNNADIVECQVETVFEDKSVNISRQDINSCILDGQEALKRLIAHSKDARPKYAVWCKLYRREIIEDLLFPVGRIHEDYFYDAVSFLRASNYIIIDKKLYCHRKRPFSITTSPFSKKDYDKLFLIDKRTEYLRDSRHDNLARISEEEKYLTQLEFYFHAKEGKRYADLNYLNSLLLGEKKSLKKSGIPLKWKFEFYMFYINPLIYVTYKKIKMAAYNCKKHLTGRMI